MHVIKLTNGKQDNTFKYSFNTNTNIDDNDNLDKSDKLTMAEKACKSSDYRIRRRGRNRRHVNKVHQSVLKIFSTNAAGLVNGKIDSLKSEVINTGANLVTVQETHFRKKGKLKLPDFISFEAIRTKKGGGTLIAAHVDLNPKLIVEYSDDFELLVVEIETKERTIRIISGYGPQENLEEDKRVPFFLALETEVEKAELQGKSIVIELDANSKLGHKYIPKDPHMISPNGVLLAGVIDRHALIVANGSDKSIGNITRKRTTKYRVEESVIDVVLLSHDMMKHFVSFHVDEDKKHVLTRVTNTKKGVKIKESDHNVLQTTFNLEVLEHIEKDKTEIYNLKNAENQKRFKEYT